METESDFGFTFLGHEEKPTKIIVVRIHWVRHAESCSNIARGQVTEEKKRVVGYGRLKSVSTPKETREQSDVDDVNDYIPEGKIASNIVSKFGNYVDAYIIAPITKGYKTVKSLMYEPNLSYIGIQQAILLGREFISKESNTNGKPIYDMVMCSTLTRAMMTALFSLRTCNIDSIKVMPFISEEQKISNDYTNIPNNSILARRKIAFVKDWIEKNWLRRFDDIEVMDLLLSIKNKINNSKISEKIQKLLESNINQEGYPQKDRETLDIVNEILNLDNEEIKEERKRLKKILDNLRGPPFDFKYLIEIEELEKKVRGLCGSFSMSPNIDYFYESMIPEIINDIIKKRKLVSEEIGKEKEKDIETNSPLKINFLIVSHGDFIRKYVSKKCPSDIGHIYNTEVFEQIVTYAMHDNKIEIESCQSIKSIYEPIRIRLEYANFETLNENICALEGLKGILNYPLIANNEEEVKKQLDIQSPLMQRSWWYFGSDKLQLPENWLQQNVKFYTENDNAKKYLTIEGNEVKGGNNMKDKYKKYLTIEGNEVKGGNNMKDKYKKYKRKYLLLKRMKKI
jgi:broad specificity phosphatase PhoE